MKSIETGKNIVVLYRITPVYADDYNHGTWSCEPASDTNADIEDYGPTAYVLPDGYRVGRTAYGERHIYDADNRYCELGLAHNEEPLLATYRGYVVLEPATPGDFSETFATMGDVESYVTESLGDVRDDYDVEGIADEVSAYVGGPVGGCYAIVVSESRYWDVVREHDIS